MCPKYHLEVKFQFQLNHYMCHNIFLKNTTYSGMNTSDRLFDKCSVKMDVETSSRSFKSS